MDADAASSTVSFMSVRDSFLKPLLLGRGVDVPMLVILLGGIGGMIMSGIIGLFVAPWCLPWPTSL